MDLLIPIGIGSACIAIILIVLCATGNNLIAGYLMGSICLFLLLIGSRKYIVQLLIIIFSVIGKLLQAIVDFPYKITLLGLTLVAISIWIFATQPSTAIITNVFIGIFLLCILPLIYYYMISGNARLYKMLCCSFQNIRLYNWYTWFSIIIGITILILVILFGIYHPDHAKNVTPVSPPSLSSSSIAIIFECIALAVILMYLIFTFRKYISDFINVIMLSVFIVAVIILFTALTKAQINKYAYLIVPITLILGFYLFYRVLAEDMTKYGVKPVIIVEQIKYIITFVLLILFMIIFYAIDPGGYITKYFGVALVFAIILSVFGLLYLCTLLFTPQTDLGQTSSYIARLGLGDAGERRNNPFLKGFSYFSIFSTIGFIIFLVIFTTVIASWPGGFMNNFGQPQGWVITLMTLACIFWLMSFALNMNTPDLYGSTAVGTAASNVWDITSMLKRTLLILSGLIVSAMLVAWLVTTLQNMSTSSGIGSFILNLIIVIAILAIFYKIITMGSAYKDNKFFKLAVDVVLYIPCIVVIVLDNLVSGLNAAKSYLPTMPKNGPHLPRSISNLRLPRLAPDTFSTGTPESPYAYIILLVVIILAYIGFFIWPYIQQWFSEQGGKLLINQPVYLNTEQTIGSYQSLNSVTTLDPTFDYQYAISCWVFIDAATPNTDTSYKSYTSLLNYGGKPNISYNASENTLRITMPPPGTTGSASSTTATTSSKDKHKLPELDDDGNIIVYSNPRVLLQKWNNIIINYNGGTLDIFYNGELVKTVIEVVPYMSLDSLTIGTNNGIHGGICNVNYFEKSLDIKQIYYLYNTVKDKTPPTIVDTNVTLTNIAKDLNINLDFSLGNLDTAIIAPVGGAIVDVSNNVLPYLEPPNLNAEGPNYLSLEWYFKHGRSAYNQIPTPSEVDAKLVDKINNKLNTME